MAAVHLGDAHCPLCGCFGARVSLSKNGLAVLTCNSSKCRGMQMFARSPGSDEMIRDRISAAPAPAPETEPQPQAEPPAPAPAPEPPPPARSGLMASWF